jgi:2-isopropylmalate synthase
MTLPLIQIYDTTLRDGTQSEGFTLSGNDKIRIAQKLDELGVAFIEGGWPGSNPKDVEFFERAKDMQWKNSLIAAFGSTCRVKGGPEDDANIKALLNSQTPVCTIFGKTWTLHVKEVLLTTLEDNLRIIEQSVAYLKSNNKRVISLMATKQIQSMPLKRYAPQFVGEQRRLCCAIRMVAPCHGK